MELSLICPVAHIEWTQLLPGRFCIAPVAMKHREYRKYFENASQAGYKVILDNGVFESDKVQDEDYIGLARGIKPHVLVAPDTINRSAEDNYTCALGFAELVKVEELNNVLPEPVELMHVVQCEKGDAAGFWRAIDDVLAGHAFQWIGICRDAVYNAFSLCTHTEDQELNRFYFVSRLLERLPRDVILKKKWHFLGIGSRLDLLRYYWFVDAMDTASLFHQATLGKLGTDQDIISSKLKRPKDYFIRDFGPEEDWVNLLKLNCQVALATAQLADELKRKLLGGRL